MFSCENYKIFKNSLFYKTHPVGDILINELRVNILTSCIYCTSYKLRVIFIAGVTGYFSYASYE